MTEGSKNSNREGPEEVREPENDGVDEFADERAKLQGRFLGWCILLIVVGTYLYVLPEIADIVVNGIVPHGTIDVAVNEDNAASEAAQGLWDDFGSIVHPFSNPLMRFFVLTSGVGWILDRVLEAHRRLRELE